MKKQSKHNNIDKHSLQKFTDYDNKLQALFSLPIVTYKDLEVFTPDEKEKLSIKLTEVINESTGTKRDKLIKQFIGIFDTETKNQTWENNHIKIVSSISFLMQTKNRMPTKNEIALETGLSRVTIDKHFKEYKEEPLYKGREEQFTIMREKVLSNVYNYAVKGDIKACRLFLDSTETTSALERQTIINNNYIQINNLKVDEETIKKLPLGTLQQIERLIVQSLNK
jgi:hypothetical protein